MQIDKQNYSCKQESHVSLSWRTHQLNWWNQWDVFTVLDATEMLTEAPHTCCPLEAAVLWGFMPPHWVCNPLIPLEVSGPQNGCKAILGQTAHTGHVSKALLKPQDQKIGSIGTSSSRWSRLLCKNISDWSDRLVLRQLNRGCSADWTNISPWVLISLLG